MTLAEQFREEGTIRVLKKVVRKSIIKGLTTKDIKDSSIASDLARVPKDSSIASDLTRVPRQLSRQLLC